MNQKVIVAEVYTCYGR